MIYLTNPLEYDNSACSEYDPLEGIYFIHNMNPWRFIESEGMNLEFQMGRN